MDEADAKISLFVVEIRNPLVIRGSSQRDYLLKPEGFKVGLFDAYFRHGLTVFDRNF
jgi:hypothetical protein